MIQARNNAEGTLNGFKKDFEQYSDKVTAEEKATAEAAIKAVEDAMEGDDPAVIQDSIPKLYEAIGPITKLKYEEEEAKKKAEEEANKTSDTPKDENVVDAEVKEPKNG